MVKGHGDPGNPLEDDNYHQNHHLKGDVILKKFPC